MHFLFIQHIMTLMNCSCVRYIIDKLCFFNQGKTDHSCVICLDNVDNTELECVDYYMTNRECKCNYYIHKKCFHNWCMYNENYTTHTKCIICNSKCKKTTFPDTEETPGIYFFDILFFLLYFRRYTV